MKKRKLPWSFLINEYCERARCQKGLKTRLMRLFPLKSLISNPNTLAAHGLEEHNVMRVSLIFAIIVSFIYIFFVLI